MADRFANGLKLTAPVADQCGRTFSRWLVEWLTQVCGWVIHDAISGNWSNVVASGADGATTATPNRFTSAAAPFTSSDIGGYLTITGFTGRFVSRNGIYRILRLISSTEVELEVERSLHEDGFPAATTGLSWRLWWPTAAFVPTSTNVIVLKGRGTTGVDYDFHLHITVRATNSYYPEFRISPFASWDNVGHAWLDSRYTTARGIDNWNSSLIDVDNCRVWGAADSDRAAIMMRVEDSYYAWHLIYLGEIDPKNALLDTKPCVIWAGSNVGNATVGDDNATLIGYGASSSINGGGVWLAFDDLTSVTGYAMIANTPASADANWISDTQRWWGERSRGRYRQPILCECRTTGYMEIRGALRRIWATARDMPRMQPVGVNGEYLHTVGGILIPWCNTKVWYERG